MLLHLFRILGLLCFLFLFNNSQANHNLGGALSWECTTNGKYVFTLVLYRDCPAVQLSTMNRIVQVFGNPLPRNVNNAAITQITLKWDSTNWQRNGYGDISPQPSPNCNLKCSDGDYGAYQKFTFRSDTLELIGVPPAGGWKFRHQLPCCRHTFDNIVTSGSQVLRAIMYPKPNQQINSGCLDSSPIFAEVPDYIVCKKELYQLDFSAWDADFDSLSYSFDKTYVSPIIAPNAVNYASNYTYNSPTPSPAIDSANIASSLDPNTGVINLLINSGSRGIDYYYVAVRVDAWRDGQLISSNFQELPLAAAVCPQISGLTRNQQPYIQPPFVAGPNNLVYEDSVIAGNPVGFTLAVADSNQLNGIYQDVRIELWGNRLSQSFTNASDCPDPSDTTCALIFGNAQYDAKRQRNYFTKNFNWSGFFSWQTNCQDLDSNGGAKTHYFYVRASDDFCDIPGVNIKTIAVTVLPDPLMCPGIGTEITEQLLPLGKLRIYPNPSNGMVFIDGLKETVDYQTFNIQGRLMKSGSLGVNQNQLELPEAEGLYFVSIRDSEGNEKTYKLVKN